MILQLTLTQMDFWMAMDYISLFFMSIAEAAWLFCKHNDLFAVQIQLIKMTWQFKSTLRATQQIVIDIIQTTKEALPLAESTNILVKLESYKADIAKLLSERPFNLMAAVKQYHITNQELMTVISTVLTTTLALEAKKLMIIEDLNSLPTWDRQDVRNFIQAATDAMIKKQFKEFITHNYKQVACMVKYNHLLLKKSINS